MLTVLERDDQISWQDFAVDSCYFVQYAIGLFASVIGNEPARRLVQDTKINETQQGGDGGSDEEPPPGSRDVDDERKYQVTCNRQLLGEQAI